jgi:uncharacterized protein YndB with AHSA1/START domain
MVGKSSGKLKVTLPSDNEILLTREFDAPPRMVYEVMTKPEYVKYWWCCMDGFSMPVCELDLRVGGRWRFVMRSPDGKDVAFNGEYREIVPAQRIVNTEIFEPYPDLPSLVTTTFEVRGDKTLFRALVLHETKEARDMHVNSGMELGAGIAYDRLEHTARELMAATRGETSVQARQ